MKINLSNIKLTEETKPAFNTLAIQTLMWFGWAFTTYGTVYLQTNGFPASTIGALNALCSGVAIFTTMFWGMISDRINSVKKTLILVASVAAVLYACTPLLPLGASYTVIMFFVYYPLINAFRSAFPPLMDNLCVRTCADKRLNYGLFRSCGSFTFTIGSLIVVWVINTFGLDYAFFASGFIYIPGIIAVMFAYDPKTKVSTGKKVKVNPKLLLKNYYYVTLLIFVSLAFIALSAEFSFITYFMQSVGVSADNLGTFLAVRALCEIPLLLFSGKLRAKFKLKYMIMFAISCMAIECFFLAFIANDLTTVMIGAVLFGLGNGMFIGSIPFYLFHLAPPELKATAQTVYSSVCAVSGIIGNLVGGFVFEAIGAKSFYLVLGCVLIIAITVFIVTLNMRKDIPNPADTLA